MLIGNGTFRGLGGHDMRGTFTLTQDSNGVLFETSGDFFFDGSPAPGWALFNGIPTDSNDPTVRAAALNTHFGDLAKNQVVTGKHSAVIPASIDLDAYDTVFLWCYRFPFVLGVGPISRV